jgi:fatty-acyl-CoA synthase
VGNVVGVPHPRFGEAVVLCAVPGVEPVSSDDITGHLRGVLASYKVPRRVLFFDYDELAYTGSQKVRLEDLRSLAARRLAEGDDTWAQFLREQHAGLIAGPPEDE